MHLTYKMMELKARKASSSGGCAKLNICLLQNFADPNFALEYTLPSIKVEHVSGELTTYHPR